MKPMKTRIVLFLLVALLTAAALVPAAEAAPPVLRLHILANSDDAADQAVKLRVRDALLPLFEAADTYEDARSFVLSHGAALLETCRAVLTAAGVPYGAQLLLGV
ncbi:MAG: stage II sporulation protein R, partial [Clostridia bacterium]|nr:stage II sporulation protein R [Clostridia bacterium]